MDGRHLAARWRHLLLIRCQCQATGKNMPTDFTDRNSRSGMPLEVSTTKTLNQLEPGLLYGVLGTSADLIRTVRAFFFGC